ncbi:MAG: DUF4143 domain-containing protein [Desulfatitalea sp.]
MVSWLLGIRNEEQIETHPLRGQIFETLIVSELMKSRFNRGVKPDFYFWRDSNGNEVDLIVEQGTRWMPIEIKSGRTLSRESFKSVEKWCALAGDAAITPSLIWGSICTCFETSARFADDAGCGRWRSWSANDA